MRCPDCGENTFVLIEKRTMICSNCNFKEDLIVYIKPFLSDSGFDLQLSPSDIFEVYYVKLEEVGFVASLHIAPQQKNKTSIIVSILMPSFTNRVLELLKIAFSNTVEIFCSYSVSSRKTEKCPLCGGSEFKGTKKAEPGLAGYYPSDFSVECTSCQRFHIHVYFYLLNLIYEEGFVPMVGGKEVTGNFSGFTVSKKDSETEAFAVLEERDHYPLVLTCLRPLGDDKESFEKLKMLVESVAVGRVVILSKR